MTSATKSAMLPVARICPDSSVNVRITGVDENANRLKDLIERYGYQAEHPILVRPMPEPSDDYDHEVVSGRSRFKGAVMAGLTEVPAVIEEMDDETALARSWRENDTLEPLTAKDKTHWIERQFENFRGKGHTRPQAKQKTAEFFGYRSTGPIDRYMALTALPEDVMDDHDKSIINQGEALAIAKRYGGIEDDAAGDAAMRAAATWMKHLPNQQRKRAAEAISESENSGEPEDLQAKLEELLASGTGQMNITVPANMRDRLDRYAQEWGYMSAESVIPMILAERLRDAGVN